jgi:hypothetical protein
MYSSGRDVFSCPSAVEVGDGVDVGIVEVAEGVDPGAMVAHPEGSVT